MFRYQIVPRTNNNFFCKWPFATSRLECLPHPVGGELHSNLDVAKDHYRCSKGNIILLNLYDAAFNHPSKAALCDALAFRYMQDGRVKHVI